MGGARSWLDSSVVTITGAIECFMSILVTLHTSVVSLLNDSSDMGGRKYDESYGII